MALKSGKFKVNYLVNILDCSLLYSGVHVSGNTMLYRTNILCVLHHSFSIATCRHFHFHYIYF